MSCVTSWQRFTLLCAGLRMNFQAESKYYLFHFYSYLNLVLNMCQPFHFDWYWSMQYLAMHKDNGKRKNDCLGCYALTKVQIRNTC